jgi:hypothetical protein
MSQKDPGRNTFSGMDKILSRLQFKGLKINAKKSFFGVFKKLDYLGYTISIDGIAPMTKKVEALLATKLPKTHKQLHNFIGMINYYRDMWKGHSTLLAPLTALTAKGKNLIWEDVPTKCSNAIKRVIGREVLLAYPNFNKPFEIHTDASKMQLGAVISQDNKPITFFSRKLNGAQLNYVYSPS